jgi:hypothetical protein
MSLIDEVVMSSPMTGRNLRWNSTVDPFYFKKLRRDYVAVSMSPRHYISGLTPIEL